MPHASTAYTTRPILLGGALAGLAAGEIAAAAEQGRLPILVGGTGLYFRALLRGSPTSGDRAGRAPRQASPSGPAAPEPRCACGARSGGGQLGGRHAASGSRYEVVAATGALADWQRNRWWSPLSSGGDRAADAAASGARAAATRASRRWRQPAVGQCVLCWTGARPRSAGHESGRRAGRAISPAISFAEAVRL